jgi:hypothetical protein
MDTPKLRDLCEQAQSSREVEDAWLAPIRTYLFDADAEGKSFTANTSLVERGVTTNKVMADALQLRPADMTPAASTRVGHALRKLGWTPRRLRNGGPRVRLYRPEEWWSANKAEWDDDSPESEAQGEREAQGEPAPATPAAEEATAAPAHPGQPDDGIGWDEKGEPAHRDNPLSHPSHPDVYTHIRQGDGYGTGVRDHGGTAIPVLRKQGGRAGTGGTGAGEEEVDLELDDHDEPACESPDSTRGAAQ